MLKSFVSDRGRCSGCHDVEWLEVRCGPLITVARERTGKTWIRGENLEES